MTRLILIIIPVFGLLALVIVNHAQKIKVNPQFETELLDDNIQIGYGLGIGDVDGDGKDDILLADKKQFVWYRNGDWQRFVMIEELTERDNVCLAVRDINGDGQVEVAVGAQWNPGETNDADQSGSVHYLVRPKDPTQLWQPIELLHEPTVHRMGWIKAGDGYQLLVVPLHGRGNIDGQGEAVKVLAYRMPADPHDDWQISLVDQSMHLTHNFELVAQGDRESLLIGGKEGAKMMHYQNGEWLNSIADGWVINDHGFGEIRKGDRLIAGIQPLHGHQLAIYDHDGGRKVLTDSLNQGHALAMADLLAQGQDQIIVGWRDPNQMEELGIKMFIAADAAWDEWYSVWIDKNGMACEDLKVADLNGDGKKDIIAAGRSTHNLKVYWNRSEK